uniref:Selenoprotein P N-terminal domain-containing protein n=1 Tax=Trichuris muris TaxID=70415 RepID=A0A5S6QVK0_TRIMR
MVFRSSHLPLAQLLLIFAVCFDVVRAVRSTVEPRRYYAMEPTTCQPAPPITHNGNLIMANYAGYVTLLALIELQCNFCKSQISSLLKLSQLFKENYDGPTKFVIVAPLNESAMFVHYYREYLLPYGFDVIQETATEPIWGPLSGGKFDFFVYDRCGRLSYYIPYPQSFMYYHYTISSLHSTHRHQRCGPCPIHLVSEKGDRDADQSTFAQSAILQAELDQAELSLARPDHYKPKNVKAWVEYIRGMSSELPGQKTSPGVDSFAAEVLRGRYVKPKQGSKRNRTRVKQGKRPGNLRPQVQGAVTLGPPKAGVAVTTSVSPAVATAALTTLGPTSPQEVTTTTAAVISTCNTTEPSAMELNETTAQIPAILPVTTPSGILSNAGMKSTLPGEEKAMGQPGRDEEETTATSLPDRFIWKSSRPEGMDCSSHSDELCLKLQGKGRSHPCCNKGLYLTGLCSPDKCNSAMNQLCCFQRYQQARYACCYDDDVPAKRPDDFNRCCYGLFVSSEPEDPCCPKSIAKSYWTRQHRLADLCMPNLNTDYSDVVFQVRLKNGYKELVQLRTVNALNYTCPYAKRRANFYLFDPSLEPDYDEKQ